jgi:hypothetical protein
MTLAERVAISLVSLRVRRNMPKLWNRANRDQYPELGHEAILVRDLAIE